MRVVSICALCVVFILASNLLFVARGIVRELKELPAPRMHPVAIPTAVYEKVWPPLDRILSSTDERETGILEDVSFLLDIAVLGHAKCATTLILQWLNTHPEVNFFAHEVCELYDQKPAALARRLYTELPKNNDTSAFQRGFKCPGHFNRPALAYFANYFTSTKLIVGLRHPVRYFESYYNFRFRHSRQNRTLPPAETLIGACVKDSQGVCTENAKFHVNLAKLGKTKRSSAEEHKLLSLHQRYDRIKHIPNPIFLYDLEQLYDTNVTRSDLFRTDLEQFLDLTTPLKSRPAAHVSIRGIVKTKAIDICDRKYHALRRELVSIGKLASRWIRGYFIVGDTVRVANREHFERILKSWEKDPC